MNAPARSRSLAHSRQASIANRTHRIVGLPEEESPMSEAQLQPRTIETQNQDTNRLAGAPIPDGWTPNRGDTRRPLEAGMEVRFPSGDVFQVVSTGPGGALISESAGREVTIKGRTFTSHSRGLQVSLYSEVSYRKSRAGIDREALDMMESRENEGNETEQGDNEMSSKISANPVRSAKGKSKAAKAAKTKTPARKATASKRAPKANVELQPCICGCGTQVARYFAPGHDARFKGWLIKIAKGTERAKDLMPSSLIKALGPWKAKGEGQVPAKKYTDLR